MSQYLGAVWGSGPGNVFATGSSGVILHYDGTKWAAMTSPTTKTLGDVWGSGPGNVLAVGADGTMWVYLVTGIGSGMEPERHHLARLADDRWTVFSEEDGVVDLWERGDGHGLLRVDLCHAPLALLAQLFGARLDAVDLFVGHLAIFDGLLVALIELRRDWRPRER